MKELLVIVKMVKEFPNDYDLGEAVREYINYIKENGSDE